MTQQPFFKNDREEIAVDLLVSYVGKEVSKYVETNPEEDPSSFDLLIDDPDLNWQGDIASMTAMRNDGASGRFFVEFEAGSTEVLKTWFTVDDSGSSLLIESCPKD